jgi:hypothetical protein
MFIPPPCLHGMHRQNYALPSTNVSHANE